METYWDKRRKEEKEKKVVVIWKACPKCKRATRHINEICESCGGRR